MKESIIKSVSLSKVERTAPISRQKFNDHLLSVEATIDFDLWLNECESWIFPQGEHEFVDGDNEMHFWMDDFMNVHWLVKVPTGHIHHKVVFIGDKIQEIADEKYNEHLQDLEDEHSTF